MCFEYIVMISQLGEMVSYFGREDRAMRFWSQHEGVSYISGFKNYSKQYVTITIFLYFRSLLAYVCVRMHEHVCVFARVWTWKLV